VKDYKIKTIKRQAGMTLIELTVVLLILVGLAGLLVPYVGSFVQKTHDSTNSNNLAQLNNAMGRFITDKNRLPHHMESLINSTAQLASASGSCAGAPGAIDLVYCGMLDTAMFTVVDYGDATSNGTGDDDAISVESLRKAGLTMFVGNDNNTNNKTFASTIGMYYLPNSGQPAGMIKGKFASVNAGPQVAPMAVEKHLAQALGGAPMDYNTDCYDYIAFGIGDKNELIGNTMTSAPVHFPENAELGPVQRYNHYVAILQVDKDNTSTGTVASGTYPYTCSSITEKAKFLGTVMNVPAYPGSHLFGVGESLSYGYENAISEQN
jgi:type II secretory pathway pseudopilin PulG